MESEQFTLVEQESLYSPEKINEITKIKEQFKIIYGNYPEIGVRAPGMSPFIRPKYKGGLI